ncbi:hypothetical protein [Roseomonas sp. AR75]|uniref:hypothetical protein n=1 Tax=Roseomonas sp. AR75 TaxID=2562311 RepID=UPI0010C03A6D|nr:hypothetical protein [Roseomonas sp. AR75]
MGTTAARLHLRAPALLDPAIAQVLGKAYARLGWSAPRRGEVATRQVAVTRHAGFLTIRDSGCAALDDGTLREVAALVSRQLGAPALVTGVLDSDSFDLLLYERGKQVDALGAGAEDAALKTVRGAKQAALWARLFGEAAMDTAGDLAARMQAIEAADSAFADDTLAAWCALAHLPAEAIAAEGGAPVAALALSRRAAAVPAAAPAETALRFFFSEDDCPYHGFHPAAWPCAAGRVQVFRWLVVCTGGMQGLTLRLALRDEGGFRLRGASCVALPFHNGQATSMTPLASWEATLDAADPGAETLDLAAPDFAVRTPVPGSRAQAILILRLGIEAPDDGTLTIAPTLATAGAACALPALTLRATRPAFRPMIAPPDPLAPEQEEALLRLNAPAIRKAVAVIADDAAARPAIRALAEAALDACTSDDLVCVIATEKHMTEAGTVTKTAREIPRIEAFGQKAWARLFDGAADLQTLRIGLRRPGDPWPLAGFLLQGSLREMFEGAAAAPTLTIALWANASPEAEAALGLDWPRFVAPFLHWVRGAAPLQGWLGEAAWIPGFDTYDDYAFTPWEMLGTAPHSRMRLHGSAEAPAWLNGRLRFVAPRLWLGPALLAGLDETALAAVAEITPVGGGAVEAALKPGPGLAALERVLAPILPVAR